MSEKRDKTEYRMGTGATSMLMIFIVLCLTTVSILALSTARRDLGMTERNRELVTGYYEGVSQAQQIIMEIDGVLFGMRNQALHEAKGLIDAEIEGGGEIADEVYDAMVNSRAQEIYLSAIQDIEIDGVELVLLEDGRLNFIVEMDYDRILDVALTVLPVDDGYRIEVTRHTLAYIDNWEPEYNFRLFYDPDAAVPDGGEDIDDIGDIDEIGDISDISDIDDLE